MIFNLKGFLTGIYLGVTRRRLTVARVGWLSLFLFLYPLFFLCFYAGWLLDEIFFRGYRKRKITAPVYILANPRSGTTYLHRLMATDPRFTTLKMYEMAFPSITQQRLLRGIGVIDARLGRPIGRCLDRFEARIFRFWQGIHPMGFKEAEEDEGLFSFTFYTVLVYLLFPFPDRLGDLEFPERLPEKTQRALMKFYERCLQRHLYLAGGEKRFLSKNVLFAGRMRSLMAAFPDARIIYLVRHPYEAIPSFVSLALTFWRIHTPDMEERSDEAHAIARLAIAYYRAMLDLRKELPPEAMLVVRYDDLVRDPLGTVERIYRHLGIDLPGEIKTKLSAEVRRRSGYRSRHTYDLEKYGISPREIDEALSDLFEEFGFPKGGALRAEEEAHVTLSPPAP